MPEAKAPSKAPAKKAQPAKKAEAKEGEVNQRFSIDKTKKYAPTGNYNPKAKHNVDSYEAICAVCPATYEDMVKAVPEHTDVIGYLIRRGALAAQ